ncbi:MAG: rRNA maturation RNase YbeY [Bacteroidales bacterium]|jgi:rRNA maturation RNase YbeY|nr:rRNA maturation RNase YbeY [Bacteroidales bacterium]
MKINFFFEEVLKPKIKISEVRKWISKIIGIHNKKISEVNFIFCNNEYLLKINQEYLGHDYFTDVITFDYSEKNELNGEIYISTEMVVENAIEYHTQDTEIYRVIIHGILHLIGFNDKTEKEQKTMREKENQALEILKHGEF